MPAKKFGASILTADQPIIIATVQADDAAIVVSFFNKNTSDAEISLGMAHNQIVCTGNGNNIVCDASLILDEDWIFDGIILGSKELFETRPIAVEENYVLIVKSSLSNINCTAYGFENQIEEEIL